MKQKLSHNFARLGEQRYGKENIYRNEQKRKNWQKFIELKESYPEYFVNISPDYETVYFVLKPEFLEDE